MTATDVESNPPLIMTAGCLRRPQHAANRAAQQVAGRLHIVFILGQPNRASPFGQIVVAPHFVLTRPDRQHLAGRERRHALIERVAGVAVVENEAAGEIRIVETTRDVAPREDAAGNGGNDHPAGIDGEVQRRRHDR